MEEPKEPRLRPLSHRSTRIFIAVLVVIVILLSALLAYLYVETAAEGQEVPEEVRSEEALEAEP